ncbi:MAG: NUDIX domain-containing protein [Brumimicrobium sp.]|nr:NUDIX domain-containing protein [Brumimicrobium sp.]
MPFNIRVYGILINQKREVLLSDERRFGKEFTKFPGGGLEFGESLKDCLIREFKEELGIDITIGELIYLTDFFQVSAFNKDDQIISVYYEVMTAQESKILASHIPFQFKGEEREVWRWKSLKELTVSDVTFPIDKVVVEKLLSKEKDK